VLGVFLHVLSRVSGSPGIDASPKEYSMGYRYVANVGVLSHDEYLNHLKEHVDMFLDVEAIDTPSSFENVYTPYKITFRLEEPNNEFLQYSTINVGDEVARRRDGQAWWTLGTVYSYDQTGGYICVLFMGRRGIGTVHIQGRDSGGFAVGVDGYLAINTLMLDVVTVSIKEHR
jgi:hypothetical protein